MFYEGSTVLVGIETISKLGVESVVDPTNPEQSLLLRKTLHGGDPHAGGAFWDERHPEYIALKNWVTEGALENQP
jgi:hypothetical protein